MSRSDNYDDLNNEIDHDFFDDENSGSDDSKEKQDNYSVSSTESVEEKSEEKSTTSSSSSSDTKSVNSDVTTDRSKSTVSNKSKSINIVEKEDSHSLTGSDLTKVSPTGSVTSSYDEDFESKPSARLSYTNNSGSVCNNNHDEDMISHDVILGAMMKIYEGRRALRTMKPKWVDPNTKDYSVSGLTSKVNLLPEKIVTESKRKNNIRQNPFYSYPKVPPQRMYHSAINRFKEQNRIEKENIAIYSRLRKVQASPGITKNELLKEYTKVSRFTPNNSRGTSRSRQSYPGSSQIRSSSSTDTRPSSSFSGSTSRTNGYSSNEHLSNKSGKSSNTMRNNSTHTASNKRMPSAASTVSSSTSRASTVSYHANVSKSSNISSNNNVKVVSR